MKRSTLTFLLSAVAALGISASANADLLYTFDTGINPNIDTGTPGGESSSFTGGTYAWDSTYQAVMASQTTGGWTLGGAGPKFEFSWPSQSDMQGIANSGQGWLRFDVIVNADSWLYANNPGSTWYQLIIAANGGSWTQIQIGSGTVGDTQTIHENLPFSSLGWAPGTSWFQLFFGSNSDAANAVNFFIDNVQVVPEPSTFALAGLGAAALLIFRRR